MKYSCKKAKLLDLNEMTLQLKILYLNKMCEICLEYGNCIENVIDFCKCCNIPYCLDHGKYGYCYDHFTTYCSSCEQKIRTLNLCSFCGMNLCNKCFSKHRCPSCSECGNEICRLLDHNRTLCCHCESVKDPCC